MPMTQWELKNFPCLAGRNASATCLKMLVMCFADVQWPAPLSLLQHFAAQYNFVVIIIIIMLCMSNKVDYPISSMPWWNVNPQTTDQMDRSLTRPESGGPGSLSTCSDERDFIKPKLITIIRNGSRPRKATRILLNKKTAHSFDQVLTEITEAIKLDTGAVKKVYTMAGRQVCTCTSLRIEHRLVITTVYWFSLLFLTLFGDRECICWGYGSG